jgi:sulfoxide reductase heme-binding subunit YedZ
MPPRRAPAPLRRRAIKPLVFIAASAPFAWIVGDLVFGGYHPDPVALTLNRLGFSTLTMLAVTLTATPARIVFGLNWPTQVRRMLGLFTFFYASAHFATYVAIDQGLDLHDIGADVVKHPFVTAGFASYLMLVPLALTSTNGWVKRLGGRRWRRLHRLVYLVAVGGVIHFVWRVKADRSMPYLFAGVFAMLFAVRLVDWARRRTASLAASDTTTPSPS